MPAFNCQLSVNNNTCKHSCDLAFVVQTNNLTYFKIDILNESGFNRSPTVLNVLKTSCHGIYL